MSYPDEQHDYGSGTPPLGSPDTAAGISIVDAGGLFDSDNVEGALAEVVTALSTVKKINGPITQAAYDALTPDADTVYYIVG